MSDLRRYLTCSAWLQMQRRFAIGCIATLLLCWPGVASRAFADATNGEPAAPTRETISFDRDWRFLQANATGAETPVFDDSTWKTVDVPHDWSIEGPFAETNPAGGAGAFLPTGVGFYRKHFSLPAIDSAKRVFVEFDGVMANSDVWINGFHLGSRPNGYVGFRYELTDHLLFGAKRENVLTVRADTSAQPASRWYAGSGIYRDVNLIVTNPVHIDNGGTFISTPVITPDDATVRVQTTVVNESAKPRTVGVRVSVLLTGGKPVNGEAPSQTIPPGKTAAFEIDLHAAHPVLWDLERPALYNAAVEVREGAATLDRDVTWFGIRDANFDAATGFWLNGRNIKLKGVCLHQDGGALGVAVPIKVWKRRLNALRAIGVNAIRTAHCPPSTEFLTLCDSMGFLVMDEMFDCWTVAKNRYDYHLYFNEWSEIDTRDTVRRDRNHPSVILYSAGNEIHDTPKAELSKRILGSLIAVFHAEDPTRPVTQALFRPNASHDYDDGLADMLDVVGTNYRDAELLAAHAAKPTRKIVGTENGPDLKAWRFVRDNAAYSGQFLWVGIDYLGESRRWPTIGGGGDQTGLLDRTGAPKPIAYQRQSWWTSKPMVKIARRVAPEAPRPTDPGYGNAPIRRSATLLCDWTPRSLSPHEESVEVYSNAQAVELFLNGKSLGSKMVDSDGAPTTWKVPFEAGTLKAIASSGGKTVAEDELRTAGAAARIVLTTTGDPEAQSAHDVTSDLEAQSAHDVTSDLEAQSAHVVTIVRAAVVDAAGVPVPDAANLLSFDADGGAEIVAVDNADNSSHEDFHAVSRHAFHGECVAYIQMPASSGPVKVTATAPGLVSGTTTIADGTVFATPGKVEPGSKTK